MFNSTRLSSVESGKRGTCIILLVDVYTVTLTLFRSHPYLFFNKDYSFTSIGFTINSNGDLVDLKQQQYIGLKHNGINFDDNYHQWQKSTMIKKIAAIIGLESAIDPDETYVLTIDNLVKILAIQMRFRCGIPVVIMGETGCGKTRLIRYMCDLAREGREARNMLILKVLSHSAYIHIVLYLPFLRYMEESKRRISFNL